jgi:hypothetical protein
MSSSYLSSNNFYSKVKTISTKFNNITNQNTLTLNINSKLISFSQGNFILKPSGNDNYVTKFVIDNNFKDVDIYLNIETSNSNIGDLYTLMVSYSSAENSVRIHFNDNFYFIAGGEYANYYTMENDRLVLEFIYDGEKFVNTDDNC